MFRTEKRISVGIGHGKKDNNLKKEGISQEEKEMRETERRKKEIIFHRRKNISETSETTQLKNFFFSYAVENPFSCSKSLRGEVPAPLIQLTFKIDITRRSPKKSRYSDSRSICPGN